MLGHPQAGGCAAAVPSGTCWGPAQRPPFATSRDATRRVFLTFAREARAPGLLFALQSGNKNHPQREDKIEAKDDNLEHKCF